MPAPRPPNEFLAPAARQSSAGRNAAGPGGRRRAAEAADPSFATTLAHGLDLLAVFQAGEGALSNGTLALRTGLSRPTVSRLTRTLAELGYLRRDPTGRFRIGTSTLAMAYPLLAGLKIRQLARPMMRDFAADAGGAVSIAMPFGLNFIYVETVRMTEAAPHTPDVGFASALAPTAVGRALLSLYTEAEFAAYEAAMAAADPEPWPDLRPKLRASIQACREQGYSLSLGEWRPEIYGVAAALYRTAEGDCLAVNCGIPSFRCSPEQVEREFGPRMLGLARSMRALMPPA